MSVEKSLPKGWKYKELNDVILLNFGVRITRKGDGGTQYPVYGGGGESFRTDSYNRQNEYVIARFAMAEKCVRYVQEKFFLLDSGITFSLKQEEANDKGYIEYFLFCIQNEIYAKSRGQAQQNLDIQEFLKIKISLPLLAEQKRIVAEIGKQLAVVEKMRQAVEKQLFEARLLPAALLRTAFSANEKLPQGWQWVKLGDVCEIKRGESITKKQTEHGNIPVIAGGRNPAYFHNKANTNPPVITVSGSGAYAGYVNFFNTPIFASDCSTIRADESAANIFYIYHYLKQQQQQIYALKQGSAQPHVYAKDLRKIDILLPLLLTEQQRIVAKIEEQLAAAEQCRLAAERQYAEINLMSTAILRKTLIH